MDTGTNQIPIDPRDTHSATPTWSGFDYQGQVSIYWALKELNQIDLDSVNEYELQIESLEDFSINHNEYPVSIHQVKAYPNKSAISAYKRAIFDLLGKGAKYPNIISCYLHTLIPINFPEDSILKTTLQEIEPRNNLIQFDEYFNLLFSQDKYEEALGKLILNKEEDNCKSVIKRLEIEQEIKEQIKEFLRQNEDLCKFEFSRTSENIDFLYLNFIYELNHLVAKGHVEGTNEIKISFSKILEILTTEFVYKQSEKTAASFLKSSFSTYFDEYCEKMELDPEEHCKPWNEKWKWILEQTDNDFLLLCKKISPTNNVDISNLDSRLLKELVVKAGAHKTFFPIIMQAENFALQANGLKEIFVLNKDGVHYLITTIAETWGKNEAVNQGKKIYQALQDDNNLSYLLFDVQIFITNELEGQFDGKIMDAGLDYVTTIPGFTKKESIVQLKPMGFINVKCAEETFRI